MKIRFNKAQLKELAQISGNLSVLFVGIVTAPAFTQVDDPKPEMLILGVAISGIFFIESLILLKGIKDHES